MNKNINVILYVLSFLDFDKLTTEYLELIYKVLFNELDLDTANKIAFNIFTSDFLNEIDTKYTGNVTYKSLEFFLRKKGLFKTIKKFEKDSLVLNFDEFILQCYRTYNSRVHFADDSKIKIKDLSSDPKKYLGRSFYLNKGYRIFKGPFTVQNLYYLGSQNIDLRAAYIADNSIYAITYNSNIDKHFCRVSSSLCIQESYKSLNLINIYRFLENNSYGNKHSTTSVKNTKYADLNLSELKPMTLCELKQYIQSKGYSITEYRNIIKNCKQLLYDKKTKTYKGFNYQNIV